MGQHPSRKETKFSQMQIMYYPESKIWCSLSHALLKIRLFERQRPNNANEGLYQMWTWSKKRVKQARRRRNQGIVRLCVTLLIKYKKINNVYLILCTSFEYRALFYCEHLITTVYETKQFQCYITNVYNEIYSKKSKT